MAWLAALAIVAAVAIGGGLVQDQAARRERAVAAMLAEAVARRHALAQIAAYLPALAGADDPAPALAALDDALARLPAGRDPPQSVEGGHAPPGGAPEREGSETQGLARSDAAGLDGFARRLERILASLRAGERPEAGRLAALQDELYGSLLADAERRSEALEAERAELAVWTDRLPVLVLAALLSTFPLAGWILLRPLARRLAAQSAELERLAQLDPATGLLARAAFLAALEQALQTRRPLALVLVDLDHFREVNDAEGLAVGDRMLREAAERIRAVLRSTDTVGRLGSDELACLLPEVAGARPLETVLSRLRAALNEPLAFADRTLRLKATLGVARYPDEADSAERLLRAAEGALVRAKRAQRGSVGRARAEDAPRIERLATALRALDAAQAEDALVGLDAALQPIAALLADPFDPGALLGFEALVRWYHPTLGAIAPEELIPAAAASGRAARLGRAVRRRALAAFVGLGPEAIAGRYLALNLAACELEHPELVDELEADLAEYGLPWSALRLEFTEPPRLDRLGEERLSDLVSLHERGVRLVLDDFGSASGGLAPLLRLPIDGLKIDRALVSAVTREAKARELIRATVGLAEALGLEVVAVGIEEPTQAALLAQLGCRAGQGWLIGRPLQGEALRAFWQARSRPPGENVVPLRL